MKILFLLESEFPPDVRVENEIYTLVSMRHTIHIACWTFKNRPLFEKTSFGAIHRVKISKVVYKSSVGALVFPIYFNFWRKYVKKIIREFEFDAVHVCDLPLARVGFELKKKKNIKYILDLHENWPAFIEAADHTKSLLGKVLSPLRLWRNYEIKMVNKADAVITVVEEMKNRLVNLGVTNKNILVVQNTVKPESLIFKSQEYHTDDNLVMLYSGGIDNQRGIDTAIEGLKFIVEKNKRVRLWIVGKGTYEAILRKKVTEFNLIDYVKFWGWNSTEKMFELIDQADVAIIPYIRTVQTDCSSPNKLFQYMYLKKPVLASNCISIKRVLDETNAGLCYVHNSARDFAEKALRLLKDEKLRKELGSNGHRAIINKYNWDNTSKDLLRIYNKEI